jgi:release factor glutamine methyltransferase
MKRELRSLLHELQHRLSSVSESPRLDAQVLVQHILDKPKAWVLSHPEFEISAEQLAAVQQATGRLARGEPLPYVLGYWEFFGLKFQVTPDVLIPRPETELLVEEALIWLKNSPDKRLVADVGTGSGCIAITLAHHLPDLHLIAADVSLPAIRVARKNAIAHNVADRINFIQSNLLSPVTRPLDCICANLPYIPTKTLEHLRVKQNEPEQALDGGNDGLVIIRNLLADIRRALSPGGCALIEIEENEGSAAIDIARTFLPETTAQIKKDLAGKDRLLCIQMR